jgi:hypothetical protein
VYVIEDGRVTESGPPAQLRLNGGWFARFMRTAEEAAVPPKSRRARGVMKFKTIYGVDFSGAKEAGRNIWIAAIRPTSGKRERHFELVELRNLARLCGTPERDAALAHLVRMIRASRGALWGIDAHSDCRLR